jgi:predicted RNase H-like HicB family nuclease
MKPATAPESLRLSISIIVEPDEHGFHAYCPGLKGIHVDGTTEEEALKFAVEAAKCYIDSLVRHNEALPVGSDVAIDDGVRKRRPRVSARHIEVRWPSLEACGVS